MDELTKTPSTFVGGFGGLIYADVLTSPLYAGAVSLLAMLADRSVLLLTKLQGIVTELRNGNQYQIRPAFALPMMVGRVSDVEAGLFLRKFGMPYWAIARLYGRNPPFWYRLERGFGRNSIVGTTVKTVPVPVDLLADEHHEKIKGEKTYIATIIAGGCVLGAEVSPSASMEDLKQAYGVFKEESLAVAPEYVPRTVNIDGWSGTKGAWSALFPMIVILRCFLHAWLKIRERGKKLENFFELGEKVWNVYYSSTHRMMCQRIRRLSDWARKKVSGIVLERGATRRKTASGSFATD
jgi:hypothetical protein